MSRHFASSLSRKLPGSVQALPQQDCAPSSDSVEHLSVQLSGPPATYERSSRRARTFRDAARGLAPGAEDEALERLARVGALEFDGPVARIHGRVGDAGSRVVEGVPVGVGADVVGVVLREPGHAAALAVDGALADLRVRELEVCRRRVGGESEEDSRRGSHRVFREHCFTQMRF